ncbi:MAG TPA: hypothetical protein GX507_09490 [Clostridia bacterium]|nr:hypothetical protein [Clostridia bacterium]
MAIILGLLATFVAAAPASVGAAPSTGRGDQSVRIYVNGERILWNDSVVYYDGKTMVPLASYLKTVGAQVSWNEAKNAAVASVAGSKLEVKPNAKAAWLNGRLVWLDVPAIVVNGRIYIPVGTISELLGATVKWDPVDQVIVIEFNDSPSSGDDWGWYPTGDDEAYDGLNGRIVAGLKYTIYYSGKDPEATDNKTSGELILGVTNVTDRPIRLEFPTSKTHDFVVRKNGSVIWRASEGQAYLPYVRTESLGPWQTRFYKSQVPSLGRGRYTVDAYFCGRGWEQWVGRTTISVNARGDGDVSDDLSALRYSLSFRPRTWAQGSTNRLAFEIRNTSSRALDVYYPDGRSYTIVVKDDKGYEVWRMSGVAYGNEPGEPYVGGILETISAGAVKYHFITLPDLARGRYTAYAYFSPAGDYPVASVVFTITR